MAQATFVQDGNSVDYTPGSAVAAGAVVVQNSLVGIARTPIAANALGSLATVGLFDVVKVTGAINAGAAIYWDADGDPLGGDAGTGAATTTSGGNTFMGFTVKAAAEADTTVRLLLLKPVTVSNTIHLDLTNVVADPGNAGAIPITDSGTVQLVTAGAETRTLAAPTDVGQVLSLCFKTKVGNCVVTCATGVNQTGNNTLTFDTAGEVIVLAAIAVGADKRWRVVANDGVGLTTA